MKTNLHIEFIQTKDGKTFYTDKVPSYIRNADKLVLFKVNDIKVSDEEIKASVIETNNILATGDLYTFDSYEEEESEEFAKKGLYNGQPIYRIM